MKRLSLLYFKLLLIVVALMSVQVGYAADEVVSASPQNSTSAASEDHDQSTKPDLQKDKNGLTQAELDKQRRALRQGLLNDRATSVQRQAIAKSKAPESQEDRETRQKLYEESAIERGENVIADREALREGRIHLDADKLRGLSSWAKGDSGSSKPMSAQQLARLRKEQESRKSISGWASGEDIKEARRKAREETKQEIMRQLRRDMDEYE